MKRIHLVRNIVVSILTSIAVAFAYELRSSDASLFPDIIPTWLIAIILFILALPIANIFIRLFFGIRIVRKLIMGWSFPEGYWILNTYGEAGDNNLQKTGILSLGYDWWNGETAITTHRLSDDGIHFRTRSIYATVKEISDLQEILYLNYFKWDPVHGSYANINGLSAGRLFKDEHDASGVQHLKSEICLFDDSKPMRQQADKIPISKVLQLRKKYGRRSWIRRHLENMTTDK